MSTSTTPNVSERKSDAMRDDDVPMVPNAITAISVDSDSLFPREEAFYGTCPTQFIDKLYLELDTALLEGNRELQKRLEQTLLADNPTNELRITVRQVLDELLMTERCSLDVNFDKFEMYVLRNIFPIPEEIDSSDLAPKSLNESMVGNDSTLQDGDEEEDIVEKYGPSDEELSKLCEEDLDEELSALRDQIFQARNESRNLRVKQSVLARNLKKFDSVIQSLSFTQDLHSETMKRLEVSATQASELKSVVKRMDALQEKLIESQVEERKAIAPSMKENKDPVNDELDDIFDAYEKKRSGLQCVSLSAFGQVNNQMNKP